jgi:hypothetical protein
MNRHQKVAWFTLVMEAIALGLSLVAFGAAYLIFGLPAHRAAGGFGFLGIMGFAALSPLLFKKDRDKVQLDERDLLIKRKAMLAAYAIFWVLFVLAAMVPFSILGPHGKVGVWYLAWMVFGGMFVVMLVQSIVILEEYGRGGKGEKNE